MKDLIKKLSEIQRNLKAPKNQYNKFGDYNYRSCEDILEGLKEHLDENCALTLNDEIVNIGPFYYIKATATFYYGDDQITSTAFARETAEKKKMDAAQCTGSASSYARKYALNALLLTDDVKDADSQDNRSNGQTYNNNQSNRNNSNTDNKKENNDYYYKNLRAFIQEITNKYSNKELMAQIGKDLGIKNISDISKKDEEQRKEMLEYLQEKYTKENQRVG